MVMNINPELRHVLPVVPCSAGRTGWLTRGVRNTGIKDVSKWVITLVQFDIIVENMFTTKITSCIFRSIHIDL